MLRDAFMFLSENSLVRRISTSAPGARTMARRFVAGETIDDGLNAARDLVRRGFFVSLDYLGEAVTLREEAVAAADTYVELLGRIGADPRLRDKVNVSLKLTQMGQQVGGEARAGFDGEGLLRENMSRILAAAKQHSIFVRFDMESSAYTQHTLDFFRSLWGEGHHNIGVVLQSYLLRSERDVRDANELGARVRLCKGAYSEPATVAFQDRADVDANYVALMKLLVADGAYAGIATHDEAMIRATTEYAERQGIPRWRWEFQMLYGIRRDLQHRLRLEGYNLRVYVPFGEAWYPYLMRRLAERPANVFFLVNSLLRESPLRFLVNRRDEQR